MIDEHMDPVLAAAVEDEFAGRTDPAPSRFAGAGHQLRTAIVTAVVLVLLVGGSIAALRLGAGGVPAAGDCGSGSTAPFCPEYRLAPGQQGTGDLRTLRGDARLLVVRSAGALHLDTVIGGRTTDAGRLVRASNEYRVESTVDFQVRCGRMPSAAPTPSSDSPSTCSDSLGAGWDWTVHPTGDRLVVRSGPDSVTLVATTASAIVPWAALPPGPKPTTAPIEPTRAAPACTAADITVSDGVAEGAMGTDYQLVRLRNTSHTSCTLTERRLSLEAQVGGPTARFASSLGESGRHGWAVGAGTTVVMRIAEPACGTAHGRATAPTWVVLGSVRIRLQHGMVAALVGGCSDGARHIGPSFGQDVPAPEGRYEPLRATVTMPATVHAGTDVDYTVRITNSSATAVRFATCPTYDEIVATTIGGRSTAVTTRYALNCAGADGVPGNGSVVFAMVMHIPTGASGLSKLSWELERPDAFVGDTALRTLTR